MLTQRLRFANCLERPAIQLGISYFWFWLAVPALLIIGHFVAVERAGTTDPYPFVMILSGLAFAWVPIEIIWSHNALRDLAPVIRTFCKPADADGVEQWFLRTVRYIYCFRNMALSGCVVLALLGSFTLISRTFCWVSSESVCLYDLIFCFLLFFVGGLSQFPFYGMSVIVYTLPRQPIERLNLFMHPHSNIMRLGRLMLQIGLGGIGLLIVGSVITYIAPLGKTRIYYQLLIVVFSVEPCSGSSSRRSTFTG